MNYAKINKTDIANGPGVRVSFFVSGCRNHCKGCFNPETWDFRYGEPYDMVNTVQKIIDALSPDYISGLTILGGEPLDPQNEAIITNLALWVYWVFKGTKTIWLYTGYKYEDVKDLEIMQYLDVLVDGPFIEELKDISLVFKGSANQRIIDVKASRKYGEIKEVEKWKS